MNKETIEARVKEELLKRDAVQYARKYDSWLFGLFTPWPSYPPQELTLDSLLTHGLPRCALLLAMTASTLIGSILLLFWLRFWALVMLAVPLGYGGYKKVVRAEEDAKDKVKSVAPKDLRWSEHCKEFFSPDSPAAVVRRHQMMEEDLAKVRPQKATKFNEHVQGATSLAVYGCGILAAGHVGGLRALEKHGLKYDKIKTLAGVSAGSVVVAAVAVGYQAEELIELIEKMPFWRLAIPELGSLLRIVGTVMQDLTKLCLGADVAAIFEPLARGTGPGVTSGKALYDMVGDAIEAKTGDRNITMKEVQDRYGKRVVIIVCELDSGKEVHLTPESNPFLPMRAAVRMSMGVPGLMEPFEYNGHYYCDGGMCNDFPMNQLPDDGHRLGLMIRPLDWIEYNYGGVKTIVDTDARMKEQLEKFPKVMEFMKSYQTKTKEGLFSVRDPLNLALTSVTVMMDANLLLQVKGALAKSKAVSVTDLAPEILTICGGRLDPFDFLMPKEVHRDLYNSGQASVHLHARRVSNKAATEGEPHEEIMPEDSHLKFLLFFLHMDPPKK